MTEHNRIIDAYRNCITEPKCKDCPWNECDTLNNRCVEIPIDLALAVMRLLKSQATKRESRAKVPCICGSRKRETWLGDAGWQFKCMKCGRRSPWGKTEKEAIQNWNKMIESMRVKQDGN